MRRVALIARREVTEILRQPGLVGVVLTLLVGIGLLGASTLILLNEVTSDRDFMDNLALFGPALGVDGVEGFAGFVRVVVHAVNFLVFTQFLGISAVLAGHTVIHDRERHTLPFLLLAPLRRWELLLGKVLGAVLVPGAVYVIVALGVGGISAQLAVTASVRELLPPSPGWLVAYLVAAPVWALVVCTLCGIASSLASDVRTAQQAVWFVVTGMTLSVGYLLTALVGSGPGAEAILAAVGLAGLALSLGAGVVVLGRDAPH